MGAPIKILSDFEDYYDIAQAHENAYEYERYYKHANERGRDLSYLRDNKVPAIILNTPLMMDDTVENVVVYTEPRMHQGIGKRIMRLQEARRMFPNKLASEFYYEASGLTLKYIHIGKRKFWVWKQSKLGTLDEGDTIKITETTEKGYNTRIRYPIYSMDYLILNGDYVVVDFNMVQKLAGTGIESIMTPEEVLNEIYCAMKEYKMIR